MTGKVSKRVQLDGMPLSIMERLISRIRLPYVVSSVVLAFLISDFGMILFRYLDTRDFGRALLIPVYQVENVGVPPWLGYLSSTLFFLLYVGLFHFVRHIRLLITDAEKELSPLLPKGGPSFVEIFARFHSNRSLLALMALFVIPFLPYFFILFQHSIGIFSMIQATLTLVVVIVLMISMLEMYIGALKGMYEFGKQPLMLKPFYEDRLLGLRRAGSLSFTIFAHYSLLNVLLALALSTNPFQNLIFLLGTGLLSILGAGFFFLALRSCHATMRQQKKMETEKMQKRFGPLFEGTREGITQSAKTMDDLWRLQALDIMDRKVNGISTWPFNTAVVARLMTLTLLPIILTVIGRLATIILLGR